MPVKTQDQTLGLTAAQTSLLEQYEVIQAQIKALQDQQALLKVQIMDSDIPSKVVLESGTKFSVNIRKSYKYPEVIIQQEKDLKAEKKKFEKTADFTPTEYLVCRLAGG